MFDSHGLSHNLYITKGDTLTHPFSRKRSKCVCAFQMREMCEPDISCSSSLIQAHRCSKCTYSAHEHTPNITKMIIAHVRPSANAAMDITFVTGVVHTHGNLAARCEFD